MGIPIDLGCPVKSPQSWHSEQTFPITSLPYIQPKDHYLRDIFLSSRPDQNFSDMDKESLHSKLPKLLL